MSENKKGATITLVAQVIYNGGLKSKKVYLNIHDTIKDVIMFVAGTTDPINTTHLKHQFLAI